ncbi:MULTISPECIES: sugar phosphate isomerase/epimerase family protein [Tenebrionibacter/Tenebrionicola group]|jgi:sugar phosphate isomerase/epimerase|uniref:Sugar phosphate isomerase/epimerase n=2 Tax=Tenebrionibacter/Tenebrionicola group TaxID=2969848 RepID=A0A8K0XYG6_9ENTR|nr:MULTISPECIES: sugar phosphate isomerase/epimerase [Tenebrionibacter/Tenebrionicola group]MBK4716643.1 sugar phosphate isomerase/epimerase [Tenebrionibacter intestinalis]MBV5097317.1 sugar phosphate isomerase/epimerase [Tenebrionicola larvae]
MARKIFVVTAAYGRDPIAAMGGQAALIPIIAAAGADGVEIRRELLDSVHPDALTSLADVIAAYGLAACYSAPEPLCLDDGQLNPSLPALLREAQQLNAAWLKLSLGHYVTAQSLTALQPWLADGDVRLVVENDQTPYGRLTPVARFNADCQALNLPLRLTFDMANWLWVGESPEEAAIRLASGIDYIHVKAAKQSEHGWRAIALDEAPPRWHELLQLLPTDAPRGIEFPLEGNDLIAVTRHYVNLLR